MKKDNTKNGQFMVILDAIKASRITALKYVNTELINLYWNVGAYISREINNANWGDKTIDELADFIQKENPKIKGFNRRGLYRMKQFYETYNSMVFVSSPMAQIQSFKNQQPEIVPSVMTQFQGVDIRNTILTQINWTNHLELISLKKDEEREFYLHLILKEGLSVRDLKRQIRASVFERVVIGNATLPSLISQSHPDIFDNFKDSYTFEFLGLSEHHSENDLQKGLISEMKNFILELGKDFIFIGEEYRVQVGNCDFYIDLLFYHRNLRCLVAFELKSEKFQPEYIGKLNFYLEALDRDVRKQSENPSIGVLLCKYKDDDVVEYALSRSLSPTLIAEYQTQLPDKTLLQNKLKEIID